MKLKVIVQTSEQEKDRYPGADEIITEPLEMEDINFSVDYFILATHHRDDDRVTLEALKKGIQSMYLTRSSSDQSLILNMPRLLGLTGS